MEQVSAQQLWNNLITKSLFKSDISVTFRT